MRDRSEKEDQTGEHLGDSAEEWVALEKQEEMLFWIITFLTQVIEGLAGKPPELDWVKDVVVMITEWAEVTE